MAAGDLVTIDSGPLAGVSGVVKKTKGALRVVVSVEMLRRSIAVELDARVPVSGEKVRSPGAGGASARSGGRAGRIYPGAPGLASGPDDRVAGRINCLSIAKHFVQQFVTFVILLAYAFSQPMENRILRAKLPTKLRLSNPERATLPEIGKRLGHKVLGEVACVARPAFDRS